MRFVVAALVLFASVSARADDLPGSLGPVRYFESVDDGTRILLIDWKLDSKVLALVQLVNSSHPSANTVFAYQQLDDEKFVSAGHATGLVFRGTDRTVTYQSTSRKLWNLYGILANDKGVRYVELQPPPGTPNAQVLINAYVEHEGGRPTDEASTQKQIETDVGAACGNKPKVVVTGLAKDGLLGKAKAAAAGLADLCRSDADYKAAAAKLTELRFERAKDDLAITKKGNEAHIGVSTNALNTRDSTLQWFKDNL